jgi:type II secretory pathway component PulF
MLLLLCIGMWVFLGYTIYVLPRQVAMWAAEERALPVVTVILINCGAVCQRFGLVVLPILMVLTFGAAFWLRSNFRRAKPHRPRAG